MTDKSLHKALTFDSSWSRVVLEKIASNYELAIRRTRGLRADGQVRIIYTPDQEEIVYQALADLHFKKIFPEIGQEQLCYGLHNYRPITDSQWAALEAARHFVYASSPGIYMYGERPCGKSHLAIGVAKAMLDQGVAYFNFSITIPSILRDDFVHVCDDVDFTDRDQRIAFEKYSQYCMRNAMRMVVTSQTPYEIACAMMPDSLCALTPYVVSDDKQHSRK